MVSRARMETFAGLVLLSVILLVQEVQFPGKAASIAQTLNTPSFFGTTADKCAVENEHLLSRLDKMDCQIKLDQDVCTASSLETEYTSWPVPFQCEGPAYEALEAALRQYRQNVQEHGPTWGRRSFGIPAHRRVLFLGNIHVQQMATSMACQQADHIARIDVIVDQDDYDDAVQTTRIEFTNNSTLVMLNDERLVVSDDWQDLIVQDTGGWELEDFDALILGLFNDCTIALKSQAFECESMTDIMFRQIADLFQKGPILFVSEMAATRSDESTVVRDSIRYYRESRQRKNMWFINGRRYISKVQLEGAAAPEDYKDFGNRTATAIVEAMNDGTLSRALPRCQGAYGGHTDLIAWDVTEFLYSQLV